MRLPAVVFICGLALSGLAASVSAQTAGGAPASPLTIQELAGNRLLWPPQVVVNAPVKIAVKGPGGQAIGSADVPAGRTFKVVQVTPTSVLVAFQGGTTTVLPSQTDILTRGSVIRNQLTAARAAAALQPTPKPFSEPVNAAPAGVTASGAPDGKIAKAIQNSLVKWDGSKPVRQPATMLNGVKYYGLYFSAHWCPPCRKFTPQLVSFYNQIKVKHPEFEIVFVSNDRDADAMANYMRVDNMPWLAIDYDERKQKRDILELAGDGIPCLVLVDADGKVLSDSYVNGEYVGPTKVMRDIGSLLENGKIEG